MSLTPRAPAKTTTTRGTAGPLSMPTGAFFRVKVDKQSIDDKTFGKLQQGAQVPVRFLEAEPRKFILQMEAEHQMAAKSDAQVDRNERYERSKINSCGCVIMSFGAVVGLGFSLGQGVDGAKLAGLGAYLFVLLGIGVFAACCANPNAAFPCCPGAEYKCAGITIAVEESTYTTGNNYATRNHQEMEHSVV